MFNNFQHEHKTKRFQFFQKRPYYILMLTSSLKPWPFSPSKPIGKDLLPLFWNQNQSILAIRKDDPIKMRGQPVEVKQQEPYLGFILHEDGFVLPRIFCYSCECWPGVPKYIICHLVLGCFGQVRPSQTLPLHLQTTNNLHDPSGAWYEGNDCAFSSYGRMEDLMCKELTQCCWSTGPILWYSSHLYEQSWLVSNIAISLTRIHFKPGPKQESSQMRK